MAGSSPNCEYGVTFTPTADCQQVQIDLVGQASNGGVNGYVAVGLSGDTSMGNDYVTECSSMGGGPLQGRLSYNVKSGNIRISGLTDQMQSQILTTLSASYVNGRIMCSLLQRLQPPAGMPSQVPTLSASSSYHLLLARGATSSSGLQRHADAVASSTSIGLLQGQSALAENTRMKWIRAHAVLMILGWLLFVPLAVSFARHLRSNWPNRRPGGLLIWFHVHRTSNVIGIGCMIVSFVCILKAADWKWTGVGSTNSSWLKAHSTIGVIALVLGWLQPFISTMRCAPDAPRRQIFNWIHRGIGFTALILATSTICIASIHYQGWSRPGLQAVLALLPLTLMILSIVGFLTAERLFEAPDLKGLRKTNKVRFLIVVGVQSLSAIAAVTLSVLIATSNVNNKTAGWT